MKKLTLREIQLEELNILKDTINYLESNHYTYFIVGGTHIGAVRHNGFIPWDDDIDIAMPREEYEKFINSTDYIGNYFVSKKIKNLYPFTKIINNNIITFDEGLRKKYQEKLWIDVFPLDGLPDNDAKIVNYYKVRNFYKKIMGLKILKFKKIFKSSKNIYKCILRIIAKCIVEFIPIKLCCIIIDNLGKKHSYSDSKFVGNYVWGYGPREKIIKSHIDSRTFDFEKIKVNGFKNYDEYLTNIYGNYMELPPEKDRFNHNIDAWRI